jgi:hypothetical protein
MSRPFVVSAEKTFTWSMVIVAEDEFDAANHARRFTAKVDGMAAQMPGLTETRWAIDNVVPVGGGQFADPIGE